jgi:CRP-like cAMP-binding protein
LAQQEKHFGIGHVLAVDGQAADVVTIILNGDCQLLKGNAPGQSTARVSTEFTSGFKTSLDVCKVGVVGARSLVGDISVLLNVLEPATVICSTAVHALQCRASVFLDQLQLPGQQCVALYTKYCTHAKLKLAWLQARGTDVDDLLGFRNLSLLINTKNDVEHDCRPTVADAAPDKASAIQATAATCSKQLGIPGQVTLATVSTVVLPPTIDDDSTMQMSAASPAEMLIARKALSNAPSLSMIPKTSIAWQKDVNSTNSSSYLPVSTSSKQRSTFLEPFPTVTRRRSLHAVSQPVVRHTQAVAYATT